MIKGMLASNASKLVAACVCPVAGTVALTVGVPPVRNAVHRATAPRAYALPKIRTRNHAEGLPADEPVQTAMIAPPCAPNLSAGPVAAFTPDNFALANVTPTLDHLQDLPTRRNPGIVNDGGGGVLPAMPGVPEPKAWMQMLIGFGIIGGAARYSLRSGGARIRVEPDEA